MQILPDIKLDFDDVLIRPQRSTIKSRKEVDLERDFRFFHSPRSWRGVPIMCANMVPIATRDMALALAKQKCITVLHKYYTLQEIAKIILAAGVDYAWMSIGFNQQPTDVLHVANLLGEAPNIVIDVPNGYMEDFVKYCAEIRRISPDSIIAAGNVVTADMTQEIIIHGGVDLIKVGIGQGSACTTRIVTGCGFPQLSACIECANAAHGCFSDNERLGLIISDGGCRTPGDVCKNFCSGADFSMIGGLFSATDQCEGEWQTDKEGNKQSLTFYGMSTHHAQEKHGEGKKDYRASEGRVSTIPYKGDVADTLQEIMGGMRSCGAYIGAKKLVNFSKCATFVRVNK